MATLNQVTRAGFRLHRSLEGTPVANDSTTYSNLNADYVINCRGWETIWLGVVLTAAGATTCDVVPLHYDATLEDFFQVAAITGLVSKDLREITVYDGQLFFRLHATTGNPTVVKFYIRGGKI